MIAKLFYDTTWVPMLRYYWRIARNPGVARQSANYWESLRGKYKGRRGFVVGNGPSLKTADLQLLKDEVSIAANRIYLAYSDTEWRPVVHTCVDPLVWKKYAREMCAHADHVVINSRLNPNLGVPGKVVIYRNLGPCTTHGGRISDDVRKGMHTGWTVTCENIQIAIHLGLNPIYLIGCDHYYKGEDKLDMLANTKQVVAHQSGTSNHFHPNYRQAGEKVYAAPIEKMEAAYTVLRDCSTAMGIQIYNATRGGHLEVYPRRSLDDILAEPAIR